MKDHNDTIRHKPDPERSAAAKGRKPPPNPWAKLRDTQSSLDNAQQQIADLQQKLVRRDRMLAEAQTVERAQAAVLNALALLSNAQEHRRWWRPNAAAISNAQAIVRRAYDVLADTRARIARLDAAQDVPDGNIAGLQNTRGGNVSGGAAPVADIQRYNTGAQQYNPNANPRHQ